jgi:hypothetical protein
MTMPGPPYQHPDNGDNCRIQVDCSATSAVKSQPCEIKRSPVSPIKVGLRGKHLSDDDVTVAIKKWLFKADNNFCEREMQALVHWWKKRTMWW